MNQLQVQLIVFLDNSLVFLFKWLVIKSVLGDLTLQALIDLLQLLEPLRCFQQVIQQLLGQGRTLQRFIYNIKTIINY